MFGFAMHDPRMKTPGSQLLRAGRRHQRHLLRHMPEVAEQ
jgi:hypothetical protein